MNNKRILILLPIMLMMCNVSLMVYSQQKHFSPQNFIKDMENFITKEACLSSTEAKAFFPIFHEMHNKQRELNHKVIQLKKQNIPTTADDKEYLNIVKEINKLKIETAEIEDTYYKKMCKVVPAKKVFSAMKANDKFHRKMLQRFDERRRKK